MSVVENLICNLFSAAVAGSATWLYSKKRNRKPYAKVTGISQKEKTIIVVPERSLQRGAEVKHATHRNHVTFEDMLGVNYVERTLTLAGLTDNYISIRGVKEFKRNASNREENVVLICSPKANRVTKELFANKPDSLRDIDFEFGKDSEYPDSWTIRFEGATFRSPSYEQTERYSKEGKKPEDEVLEDYALLARIQNPWNEKKKLMIVSGIRGIGTWGAARCLREHTDELMRKSEGHDFACITNIACQRYKLSYYNVSNHFAVFRPNKKA